LRSHRLWPLAIFIVGVSLGSSAVPARPQEKPEKALAELKEKASRTGVFFRADTPRALRNSADPFIPVYLEIINGLEKTGRTTASPLAQYLSRDPLKLEGVNIYVKPTGPKRQFTADVLPLGASKEFSWDCRTGGQPLTIADRMKRTLEIPREVIDTYLKTHYLGGPFTTVDFWVAFRVLGWPSQNFYLRVRLNAEPLPHIANWYRGDMHYHCAFTDNPAERGYPLDVTKQAGLHAGFDWTILTDHSTDLSPERYAEELRQVTKYRDGRFLFIRGEELTLASGKESLLTTVHMVAMPSPEDPDQGFPDPAGVTGAVILTGDGSLKSPALPVKEALRRVVAARGFAYAAHPFDPISPILRGGTWDLDADFLAPGGKQLQPGLVGLAPWNRATMATGDDARDPFCLHRDADPTACFQFDAEANQYKRLEKAIEVAWKPLLQKGLEAREDASSSLAFKVFLGAGSDAHGDFNYEATMDVVDFLGKPSRGLNGYAEDNGWGKLATVVACPQGMGRRGENVLRALRDGRSVLSNGPLLIAGFDRNGNGSLDDPEDIGIGQEVTFSRQALPPLQLVWASSKEFGPLRSIRLIVGSTSGESQPEEIVLPSAKALASGGLFPLDLQGRLQKLGAGWGYIRLEAQTQNSAGEEFRCYTNPIWVRLTER